MKLSIAINSPSFQVDNPLIFPRLNLDDFHLVCYLNPITNTSDLMVLLNCNLSLTTPTQCRYIYERRVVVISRVYPAALLQNVASQIIHAWHSILKCNYAFVFIICIHYLLLRCIWYTERSYVILCMLPAIWSMTLLISNVC